MHGRLGKLSSWNFAVGLPVESHARELGRARGWRASLQKLTIVLHASSGNWRMHCVSRLHEEKLVSGLAVSRRCGLTGLRDFREQTAASKWDEQWTRARGWVTGWELAPARGACALRVCRWREEEGCAPAETGPCGLVRERRASWGFGWACKKKAVLGLKMGP